MQTSIFPFTAVVGQTEFKLALLLNLIDPTIGGVLAIGDKGTGKTTLIRSLAALMAQNENFPFVNLPIGATEDRLIGSVNLETLINEKKEVVKPGLLNKADKGILYVDEVNLLQVHLMDVLLDASASGTYYLEREGISYQLDSRFCLVGSMNPEEGELRPQLKDRFGLGVEISTTQNIEERTAIIKARMAFDANPEAFIAVHQKEEMELLDMILTAQKHLLKIVVPDTVIDYCSELALRYHVEGLRADILLLKTAKAYGALNKMDTLTTKDVDSISELVLFHRKKIQQPNTEPPQNQSESQQERQEGQSNDVLPKDSNEIKSPLNDFKRIVSEQKTSCGINTAKYQPEGTKKVDIKKTVGQYLATDTFKLNNKRDQQLQKEHHIFLLDASGSMLSQQINTYAKGAVEQIALKYKTQNTYYSIVVLSENTATVLLNNNPVLSQLEEKLATVETGGKTNLQAGLKKVKQLSADPDFAHHLSIVTDGKFTASGTLEHHVLMYNTLCKGIHNVKIIDAEQGPVKFGMAKDLADRIQAVYEPLVVKS